MSRVYIHEFVDVDGTKRAHYQHHMTANWCPGAGPLRRQRCFGVFTVVGSTGRWPQVVNLWEYESWDDLAHNFSVELVGGGHRDPMLEAWWTEAASFRTGGHDRILLAHDDSPGVEQWCAEGGTGAVAYVHEVVTTTARRAPDLLDEVVTRRHELSERFGFELVGAFRTAMRADDELIVIRSVPDWSAWADYESSIAGTHIDERVVGLDRVLLVDAELSPLRIGRQPSVDDRRTIEDL